MLFVTFYWLQYMAKPDLQLVSHSEISTWSNQTQTLPMLLSTSTVPFLNHYYCALL